MSLHCLVLPSLMDHWAYGGATRKFSVLFVHLQYCAGLCWAFQTSLLLLFLQLNSTSIYAGSWAGGNSQSFCSWVGFCFLLVPEPGTKLFSHFSPRSGLWLLPFPGSSRLLAGSWGWKSLNTLPKPLYFYFIWNKVQKNNWCFVPDSSGGL